MNVKKIVQDYLKHEGFDGPVCQDTEKWIVEKYLKHEGFDGLVCQDTECGCLVGDAFACCDGCVSDCEPGHRHAINEEHTDWFVFPGKCGPDCLGTDDSAPDWIEVWVRGAQDERTDP